MQVYVTPQGLCRQVHNFRTLWNLGSDSSATNIFWLVQKHRSASATVSGYSPSRKKSGSSVHVIDTTDASSCAPFQDATVSNWCWPMNGYQLLMNRTKLFGR